MPWYLPWSELITKKVCRFLLQRYLGQFLEEKLSLDQLNVDITKGIGTITDVTLYSQAINELCESQGWGIEVTGGQIGSIEVNVPWNSIMTDDSNIKVTNLFVTIKPLAREKDGTSMLESMWSSMSSSMQLAQDCLQKDDNIDIAAVNAQSNVMEGLERFAQTIDNVLNRIKAKLIDTEIRLEYMAPDCDRGVALIIKIKNLEYDNEAGGDPPDNPSTNRDESGGPNEDENQRQFSSISTYSTHHIKMDGITFYTEEFRINDIESRQRPSATQAAPTTTSDYHKNDSINLTSIASEQFYSTISELPEVYQQPQSQQIENDLTESQLHLNDSIEDEEEDEQEEDEEEGDRIDVYRTEHVMLGSVTGCQEIRIKMKQTENIQGPKVQLELTLGALNFFMSPRQLHYLVLLSDVFVNSSAELPSAADKQRRCSDCPNPVAAAEINLKRNLNKKLNPMSDDVSYNQGWSTDLTYENSHQYHQHASSVITNQPTLSAHHRPSTSGVSGYNESIFSSHSSMTSSMCSSAISQSTQNTNRARRRGIIDADPNADISHLNIRISCCAIVLLHEEILIESPVECPLTEQSVTRLRSISDEYFEEVGALSAGVSVSDMIATGKTLDKACSDNHLRLLLAPIIIEGEEQRNINGNLLRLTASIARADFREVLTDVSVPLVEFLRKEATNGLPSRPEITLTLKQTTHTQRGTGGRRFEAPKTEINFSLESCLTEFDVSIMDRLNAIFSASPLYSFDQSYISESPSPNNSKSPQLATKDDKIIVKLDASSIDFRLRFPIADLRPIHDPKRIPWWKRNVRSDFLLLNLIQMRMNYTSPSKYEIAANEINVHYCESEDSPRIDLAKAILLEKPATKFSPPSIEYPRVTIDIPSVTALRELNLNRSSDESGSDGSGYHPDSIDMAFSRSKDFSPFSSKRMCRESDTKHSTSFNESDGETLLVPGDKTEMNEFCDEATKTSKLQIRVFVPLVSFQLKSKHLYEILYNRINSDLLLWEPCAPCRPAYPSSTPIPATSSNPVNSLLNCGMMDSVYVPFAMCKSGINYDSSSATNSESEVDSDTMYHSIYDSKRQKRSMPIVSADKTSAITFQLSIEQGMLTMYSPVRDSQNHVIPGQLGEFVIKINSAVLFSVNGYHGNDNLGYLCLQVRTAELYHFGLTPVPSPDPPLRLTGCMLPAHMQSTFYPSPQNISLCDNKNVHNRDMISLAIQIKSIPDQRIKKIKVAAGIKEGTLRHFPAQSEHTWLTQLIDMFDATDYPVQGYTPMGVVTEMHLHLWDCAIDYRPRHFPYRSIVTLGTFMMSSNISTSSSGCTLRFIAEDCTMCLAPQKPIDDVKKRCDNKITVLSSSELVCVVELGLFEISLRLNDKATSAFPKLDLRASINGVHLRTCSDSADALSQLIFYLATDGDLPKQAEDTSDDEALLTQSHELDAELLQMKSTAKQAPGVTESQQIRVSSLMEDAMQENLHLVPQQQDECAAADPDVEVFFFPDEAVQNSPRASVGSGSSARSNPYYRSQSLIESRKSSDSIEFNVGKDEAVLPTRLQSDDTFSVNTEMQDLLDFENSMMGLKSAMETEVTEALPQVATELGNITARPVVQTSKKTTTRKLSSDTDDDYCFISYEEKPKCAFEDVETTDDPIHIVDNHFTIPGKPDLLKAPPDFPMAVVRYTLCEMTLNWQIYGGHDFPKASEKSAERSAATPRYHQTQSMSETYKKGVSYSKGSSNVVFGKPVKRRWKERGGHLRNHDVMMEIQISKLRFSHETYPTQTEQASRQVLVISDIEILDRLVCSNIRKFLYMKTDPQQGKKKSQHMLVIKALHLRPDPALTAQECCLRISLLPLRLNIDQDALLFLVDFFNDIGGSKSANSSAVSNSSHQASRRHSSPQHHQLPVMMVDDVSEVTQEYQARKLVSDNLMLLMEDDEHESEPTDNVAGPDEDVPIYFRNVVFSPSVVISFDYHGKRVELSHGPLPGLLMGLGTLQHSEIRLIGISHRHGILGVDRLLNFLLQTWLQDIKQNQLSSVLMGVGPMFTVVQFIQGIRDLFWLPILQYQKDGRIVRGLQLGAQSFTSRTALAALEITTRLIQLLQITAETAYDMVSPGPSVRRIRGNRKGKRKRMHPPQDIREGVTNALTIVREGVGDTAHTIVEMAALEHDQKGYTGAVGAVIRQIPPTVVKPLVLATQATSNLLGGVKNQLVPDARREARDKWKDDEE